MARLTEEERKAILGNSYTPTDPNEPPERNAFSFIADILRSLFGKRTKT